MINGKRDMDRKNCPLGKNCYSVPCYHSLVFHAEPFATLPCPPALQLGTIQLDLQSRPRFFRCSTARGLRAPVIDDPRPDAAVGALETIREVLLHLVDRDSLTSHASPFFSVRFHQTEEGADFRGALLAFFASQASEMGDAGLNVDLNDQWENYRLVVPMQPAMGGNDGFVTKPSMLVRFPQVRQHSHTRQELHKIPAPASSPWRSGAVAAAPVSAHPG